MTTKPDWSMLKPDRADQTEAEAGTSNDLFGTPWSIRRMITHNDMSKWGFGVDYASAATVLQLIAVDSLRVFAGLDDAANFFTSPDGVTWTLITATTQIGTPGLALGYGVFASRYSAGGAAGQLSYSNDSGATWISTPNPFAGSSVFRIVAAETPNLFVAVAAAGKAAYSADGITWTISGATSFGGDSLQGLAYSEAQSKYIAVGTNGKMASTPDGSVWTSIVSPGFGSSAIQSICFSESLGVWIATANDGKVGRSVDGVAWVQITNPFDGSASIRDVTYSESLKLFIAFASATAELMYSIDGTVWVEAPNNGVPVSSSGGVAAGTFIDRLVAGARSDDILYNL